MPKDESDIYEFNIYVFLLPEWLGCSSNLLMNIKGIFKNWRLSTLSESTVIEIASYLVTQPYLSQNILYTKRDLIPAQL